LWGIGYTEMEKRSTKPRLAGPSAFMIAKQGATIGSPTNWSPLMHKILKAPLASLLSQRKKIGIKAATPAAAILIPPMIELTFNALFLIYLCGAISFVMGIWIYSHYRMRNRVFLPIEKALCICEFCHFAYVEESSRQLNRCPQCGLFNKQNMLKGK
jgi:hypothetical protein